MAGEFGVDRPVNLEASFAYLRTPITITKASGTMTQTRKYPKPVFALE